MVKVAAGNGERAGEPDGGGGASGGDAFAAALGARLRAAGVLDDMALRRAGRARQQSGERFDLVLAKLGLVPEDRLAAAVAGELGLTLAAAADMPGVPVAIPGFDGPAGLAFLTTNRLLPLAVLPDRLVVAAADPFGTAAADALAFLIELPVERRLAAAGDIDRAFGRLYAAGGTVPVPGGEADRTGGGDAGDEDGDGGTHGAGHDGDDVRRLRDLSSEAPVIRLVQDLIVRAVEARASDIHIEPRVDSLRVRFRVDGVLHTVETLAPALAPGVTSRVKILARLDIAQRRLPQDGRIKSVVRGREIDLRVSTMPAMNGESCVLRILDRGAVRLDFPALGFDPALRTGLEHLLGRPHGIVLVTGPTGSGKTTTLYTALGGIDREALKIFTVEDPIEYQLPDINQIQVQPRIGLTFAAALRSILRQDPDVIMIGEIRDLETAQIAIQASLTGHLVLSTVHTNSAAATITRLLDMGLESYLLASSLTGVLAQRLVRRLCPACAAAHPAPAALLARLEAEAAPALHAARAAPRLRVRTGCGACRQTGYSGRTVIGELLPVTPAVRGIIHAHGSDQAVEAAAVAGGMATLYQDGIAKVLAGQTTFEEVLRVTRLA
jgi:general secretion pathway protein E